MKRKGLSLLEILVATLILALVMTGLASIFVVGKRYILRTRSRMTAGEIGKYFLEPLQMDVRQDQWNNNCVGGGNCPSSSVTTPQTLDNIQYNATYSITDVSGTTLRRARVTFTWAEPSP